MGPVPFFRALDETRPADAWDAYGLSKRVAEMVAAAAGQEQPGASIVLLRLMFPMNDEGWRQWALWRAANPREVPHVFPMGPDDTRRLFLAAIALERPGVHTVQATGDVAGRRYAYAKAREVLGWRPEGS